MTITWEDTPAYLIEIGDTVKTGHGMLLITSWRWRLDEQSGASLLFLEGASSEGGGHVALEPMDPATSLLLAHGR